MESMSTEKTRAPSFASSAARGRPTTSDLARVIGVGDAVGRDFVPVDHCDSLAVGAVPVWQERVVHLDVFKAFDGCERCARQDRLDVPWRSFIVHDWGWRLLWGDGGQQ